MKIEQKMRIIIDTNIFISGLISKKGAPSKIINAVLQGWLIPVVSQITLAELINVLQRPRLQIINLAATIPQPDFIVTGDKDFTEKSYFNVPVISATMFVNTVLDKLINNQ